MRYRNREAGIDLDLAELDAESQAFFASAVERFKANQNLFDFERFAFGFSAPVFQRAKSRAEVLGSPLYLALKALWLCLGVRQGLMAGDNDEQPTRVPESAPKARKAHSHGATRTRHLAASNKPRLP